MAFALRVSGARGEDLRVRPLPLFYRSWGRGEWHSPHVCQDQEGQISVPARLLPLSVGRGEWHSLHVCRGRKGIQTPPNEARPTGLFFGISPPGSRLRVSPHGESESFLATPIPFELEPVSLEVLSADSPHVYSLLGLLVK